MRQTNATIASHTSSAAESARIKRLIAAMEGLMAANAAAPAMQTMPATRAA